MRFAAVAFILAGLAAAAQPNPGEFDALTELLRSPQTSVAKKKVAIAAYLAAHQATRSSPRMALVFRAQEALVTSRPAPPSTFFARLSVEECRRLTAPLRKKPQLFPDHCEQVVRWQAGLDAGWRRRRWMRPEVQQAWSSSRPRPCVTRPTRSCRSIELRRPFQS